MLWLLRDTLNDVRDERNEWNGPSKFHTHSRVCKQPLQDVFDEEEQIVSIAEDQISGNDIQKRIFQFVRQMYRSEKNEGLRRILDHTFL